MLRVPKSADVRAALGASLVDMVDRGSRDERLLSWGTKIGCLTDAQIQQLGMTQRDHALLFWFINRGDFKLDVHRVGMANGDAGL